MTDTVKTSKPERWLIRALGFILWITALPKQQISRLQKSGLLPRR